MLYVVQRWIYGVQRWIYVQAIPLRHHLVATGVEDNRDIPSGKLTETNSLLTLK